jgi:hypothetical protein
MTVFIDIIKTLYGMFVADWRLTVATLTLVVVTGLLQQFGVPGLWSGCILLLGCIVILVSSVILSAKRYEGLARKQR